jgi:hypothetical protein
MSSMAFHILVGRALTDPKFREALLSGSCRGLMADLQLSDEEQRAILAIRATSIQEFAAQLTEWLDARAGDGGEAAAATRPERPCAQPAIGC